MTENKNINNWLDEELKQLGTGGFTGERLPALKLEPGKIFDITVDISKPFEKYTTQNTKGQAVTKAIIPVTHNNEKKIFWLNVKNPLYREVCELAKIGKTKLKVLQVGTQADTKYQLIKE